MLRAVVLCSALALSLDCTFAFSLRTSSIVHGSSFSQQIRALKGTCSPKGPRVNEQARRGQGIRMGLFDSLVKLAMPTEVHSNNILVRKAKC